MNTLPEFDSTETYDARIGSWNVAQAILPRPMGGLRATNIDNRVLIFGIVLYEFDL